MLFYSFYQLICTECKCMLLFRDLFNMRKVYEVLQYMCDVALHYDFYRKDQSLTKYVVNTDKKNFSWFTVIFSNSLCFFCKSRGLKTHSSLVENHIQSKITRNPVYVLIFHIYALYIIISFIHDKFAKEGVGESLT